MDEYRLQLARDGSSLCGRSKMHDARWGGELLLTRAVCATGYAAHCCMLFRAVMEVGLLQATLVAVDTDGFYTSLSQP
jgi:hypothetical protein